jgi:hypothetical protein
VVVLYGLCWFCGRSQQSCPAVLSGLRKLPGDDSWTTARWTGPSGHPETGTVFAAPGAQAASRTPIWIDSAGQYTDGPPLSRDAALLRVTASGPLVLATALLFARGLG